MKNYEPNFYKPASTGTEVFNNSLPYSMDPTRTLNYWSNGDGIIYYKIEPKPEPEPRRLPIAVLRYQYAYRFANERRIESFPRRRELARLKTLSGYQDDLETGIDPIIIGKCIIAFVHTAGTIVEDVFTTGVGVADDTTIPVVWAWALSS